MSNNERAAALTRLIAKIEACGFECVAGPLDMSIDWANLKKMLAAPVSERAADEVPPFVVDQTDPLWAKKLYENMRAAHEEYERNPPPPQPVISPDGRVGDANWHPADNGTAHHYTPEQIAEIEMQHAAPSSGGEAKAGECEAKYSAHELIEQLIDVIYDEENHAPEDRCYVEGAYGEVLADMRKYLASAQQSDAVAAAKPDLSENERKAIWWAILELRNMQPHTELNIRRKHDLQNLLNRSGTATVPVAEDARMPSGWRLYSADFSLHAKDTGDLGHIGLIRDPEGRKWWLQLSEEERERVDLYAYGKGATFQEAIKNAIDAALAADQSGDKKS